jgi:hypothetical protein
MDIYKVIGPVVILALLAILKGIQTNMRSFEPRAFQENPKSEEERGRYRERYERAQFWEGGLAFTILIASMVWLIALAG